MQNLSDLTVVILAGGLGTRLRSVISDQPKVLAQVNGQPFLTYLLDRLELIGFKKVVLCTGYLAKQVKLAFGNSYHGLRLSYSQEIYPLGTGGALKLAQSKVDSDVFLVFNGDSFCEVDLTSFWSWHQKHQANVTILLTKVSDMSRYGKVEIDDQFQIIRFKEKGQQTGPGLINAGIYLISKKMIPKIPTGKAVSLEKEIFPSWIHQGFYGYPGGGRFIDIGTPESLAQAESFFKKIT